MSKQRTKEQKQRAKQRRLLGLNQQPSTQGTGQQVQTIEPKAITSGVPTSTRTSIFSEALSKAVTNQSTAAKPTPGLDLQTFFGFDPKLIYRDLTKTIIISVIILVLLVVFSRLPF